MNYRTMILTEKYYPILANINILIIHLTFWVFKYDIRIYTAMLFGFSLCPWLVIYGYSIRHYFCRWHRILLINILVHGIFASINMYLNFFGYEMLRIFFVTLSLNALAILFATILYRVDGCFKRPYKRTFTYGKRATLRGIRKDERGVAKAVEVFRNTILFHLHKNTAK